MNIIIPKAENTISSNYFVDCFVEYVRANGYPKFSYCDLTFLGGGGATATCSELDKDKSRITIEFMRAVLNGAHTSGDAYVSSFDGGMYKVNGFCFTILVDGHLYFLNFYKKW